MQNSRFNRVAVPQMGVATSPDSLTSTSQPGIFCKAGECPLRVLLRNNGFGPTVFIAYEIGAIMQLTDGPGADVFELPAGASETFVVAPGQSLYLGSLGIGAIVSGAISQALPPDVGDERPVAP